MNSNEWWSNVKANETTLHSWLKDQVHGERLAAKRLAEWHNAFNGPAFYKRGLDTIAKQEAQHAEWIAELLATRGIADEPRDKDDRYWKETLPEEFLAMPEQELAAIGAHAEGMRLERIRVIAEDNTAPADIRSVFVKILVDELFHEKFFRKMAGAEAMAKAKDNHDAGRKALGLTA